MPPSPAPLPPFARCRVLNDSKKILFALRYVTSVHRQRAPFLPARVLYVGPAKLLRFTQLLHIAPHSQRPNFPSALSLPLSPKRPAEHLLTVPCELNHLSSPAPYGNCSLKRQAPRPTRLFPAAWYGVLCEPGHRLGGLTVGRNDRWDDT